jgi:hypothetical protein
MNRELIANKGMILTNGTIYGRIIYVADDVDINSFYEITEEEYNKIMEMEENENVLS